MKWFKHDDTYYLVFKKGEVGNPHPTGCPCILDTRADQIPFGDQRSILTDALYAFDETFTDEDAKNLTTHDMVQRIAFID